MNEFENVVVSLCGVKMRVKTKVEVCRKFYNENPGIQKLLKDKYPNANIYALERCFCDKCFTKRCMRITEEFLKCNDYE